MELHQLRCFVVVAEELHFGRAAQRLSILPSALGRHIRMLEENLGTRLFTRTTRKVALTDDGLVLLEQARALLVDADKIVRQFRAQSRAHGATLRIGAIDSASSGFLPMLLHDFRLEHPDVSVQLIEDKTVKLLPRLLSGSIDVALLRPPEMLDERLRYEFLTHENIVVAVPSKHPLASHEVLKLEDLKDQQFIVPERQARPHSYHLTMKLFAEAGLNVKTLQIADEKQTIINLVGAEIGLALVPQVTTRLNIDGVRYIPLDMTGTYYRLSLGVAWPHDVRDPVRDDFLNTLRSNLQNYQGIV